MSTYAVQHYLVMNNCNLLECIFSRFIRDTESGIRTRDGMESGLTKNETRIGIKSDSGSALKINLDLEPGPL